jgi:FAD binding domain/DDE superfamily endonuclease
MPMPTFPLVRLGGFRAELHACYTRRPDALFELGDALLCAPAITSVAQLSLEPSHQRGWGSAYDALASGRINVDRLRDLLVRFLPDADPLVFAVDVTTWPRCDGHCFAGRSVTPGLLIDVTPMASVSISGGLATVGTGARLGAVYQSLQVHGLAIPAGTCPPVGVAGLTLGGGPGILGRSYGVTSDRLIAAQVVLGDGRVLDCDEHHNEDLFWGLRGAGAGNFEVVTSLLFRTIPAPQVTNFHLTWPPARTAALIEAWQRWAPLAPDQLYASLKLTAADEVDQPASLDVYGALLGSESDAHRLLDALAVRAGADPTWAWVEQLSFAETRRFGPSSLWEGPAVGMPPTPQRRSTRIWLPSRSSSGGRCPPRPPPHWWSTWSRADRQASSASWTSARGGAPTTACPPMPAPSSTAMRCSSSSTRWSSTPKPPRTRSRPRTGG